MSGAAPMHAASRADEGSILPLIAGFAALSLVVVLLVVAVLAAGVWMRERHALAAANATAPRPPSVAAVAALAMEGPTASRRYANAALSASPTTASQPADPQPAASVPTTSSPSGVVPGARRQLEPIVPHHMIEFIQTLPQFNSDIVLNAPGIFPCNSNHIEY